MLHAHLLEEVNRFGDQVRVELVQAGVEKGREVLWNLVTLLQARAKAVCQCRDVRNVVVLANFYFFLDVLLELRLAVGAEEPLEDSLLDLLVVFVLEELVGEEFH